MILVLRWRRMSSYSRAAKGGPPAVRSDSIEGNKIPKGTRLTNPAPRGDTPPFEVVAGTAEADILIICDHASNRIPRHLDSLGLTGDILTQHVAWDVGAAALTRALAQRLGAPAVLTTASRLVIDCNRAPGHVASVPADSHGVPVPGNQNLGPTERARRVEELFVPYHARIEAELSAIASRGQRPLLLSIHSFTPVLTGPPRPWHVGALSDRGRSVADFILRALRRLDGLVVGDNEPYSGRHPEGYSCQTHGDARGRLNVLLEIRQDHLAGAAGVAAWAARLAPIITTAGRHPFGAATGSAGAA